jgi:beta-galactosidase
MLYPSIEVVNDGPGAISFTLTSIVSFGGAEVGRAVSVGLIATAQDRATLNQTIDLGTAHLWGITHPNLYTLTTILTPIEPVEAADTQASDVLNTTFGVRTIRFDATNGFFLNGQATKILGCANHQDIAGLGTAVPDALQAYRITALQEFGANAWRTAHNQPSKALLEAADRLGFLVWDENHHNGQPYEMELLIRRECARPLHTAPLMHPPVYSRASLLLTVASIRSPSLARASSAAATTHRL